MGAVGVVTALYFFKDGTENQVVQLGRRVLRERECVCWVGGRGRRGDKREQEVDGKVIAVSTWSVA